MDQRLVRERRIAGLSSESLGLYLFLVVVGDTQGLSYYSERSICEHLPLDAAALQSARRQLVQAELIAYRKPLYQVLSLDTLPAHSPERAQLQSIADVLRQAARG